MLQNISILILLQFGFKISLVLTEGPLGAEYYDEHIIEADDGFNFIELKAVQLKDEVSNDDENEIQPKKEQSNGQWVFKHMRAKKEVRGFDLTDEEKKKFKIWNDGVIPYYIDVVSFSDKVLRDMIRRHLQMVNSATGINFVELEKPSADDKERWVFFMNRRGLLGCADHNVHNFTNEGVQRVVLGYDCMSSKGELAEAVMSILGIPAEHNSPDRDEFIKVRLDNVMPDKKHLFQKLGNRDWLFHDLPYDFNSVTHYDLYKYSVNGRATIVPTHHYEDFKPSTKYSPSDLRKIKMLYSYIVKKKKMETGVCEKLFDVGNLDKRDRKRIKSRHKPSQYLGYPKETSSSLSSVSSDTSEEKERKENKQEANPKKGEEEYSQESDKNVEKLKPNPDSGKDENGNIQSDEIRSGKHEKNRLIYNKNKKKSDSPPLSSLLMLSDYDSSPDNNKQQLNAPVKQKSNPKWKKSTTKSSLLLLSDFDSTEDVKRVPLKAEATDPLTLLSDYQTDEGK